MRHLGLVILAAGVVVGAALVGGCGPAKPPEARVVFYPPPPDQPRLQYLLSITNVKDWQPQQKSTFTDFIVGSPKGGEDEGDIKSPYGIAAYDGKIYVCDLGRFKVHIIDVLHKSYATLGQSGELNKPANITIDADGTKYVSDAGKQQVIVYDAQDHFVRAFGDPKQWGPIAVAIKGDELFVADATGGKVEVYAKDGQPKRTISSKGTGTDQLRRPAGIAIDSKSHLFVTDMEQSTIKEFDTDGHYIKSIGAPGDRPGYMARPKGIVIDSHDNIYVADAQWDKIQIFTPEGQLLLYFGESTRDPHGLVTPTGLAIDTSTLEAFRKYVDKSFEPEYILLVTNQFGVNRVSVNVFGHAKLPEPATPATATATGKPK